VQLVFYGFQQWLVFPECVFRRMPWVSEFIGHQEHWRAEG